MACRRVARPVGIYSPSLAVEYIRFISLLSNHTDCMSSDTLITRLRRPASDSEKPIYTLEITTVPLSALYSYLPDDATSVRRGDRISTDAPPGFSPPLGVWLNHTFTRAPCFRLLVSESKKVTLSL